MDNSNESVEKALDDLFSDDINVVSLDSDNNLNEENNIEITDNDNEKDNSYTNYEEINNAINDSEIIDQGINNFVEQTYDDKTENYNEDVIDEIIKNEEQPEKKNVLIYFIFGFIFGLLIIFFMINKNASRINKMECIYDFKDDNFKIKDKYEISYKNKSLVNVKSNYSYEALSKDFEGQIDIIKNEKLAVIINSFNIDGIDYNYEISSNYLKINGNIEFDKINKDVVNKYIKDNKNVAYFDLLSKDNYTKLVNKLEKDGYTCKSIK